jgi:hypothetical protein
MLEKIGKVVAVKTHSVSRLDFLKLLFQLYLYQSWAKSMSELVQYSELCMTGTADGSVISIVFELNDGIDMGNVRGRKAPIKESVRRLWNHGSNYKTVHIHDTHYEAIEYTKLYHHRTTWKMMRLMNLENMLRLLEDPKCYIMMNTLRKTLYDNFSLEFIDRFIIVSSMMLYVLGMRLFNDIDGFVLPGSQDESATYTKYFQGRKWLSDELKQQYRAQRWLPFTDFMWIDRPETGFQPYMRENYDKYARLMGDGSIDEMMTNSRHYFYMFGFKFPVLQFEILKRLYRYKPASWADLIAMERLIGVKVYFPALPTKISHYYKSKVDSVEQFTGIVVRYLVDRYGIRDISAEDVAGMMLPTVHLGKKEDKSIVRRLIRSVRLSSTRPEGP